AAMLQPGHPVSIGLPLNGWDLVVIDAAENPVGLGEVGELVIGGGGLARYLDAEKDAEKYAPLPSVGWNRAYRTGDHVRVEEDGAYFVGRAGGQAKTSGARSGVGDGRVKSGSLADVGQL